jgi:hypothetical protein
MSSFIFLPSYSFLHLLTSYPFLPFPSFIFLTSYSFLRIPSFLPSYSFLHLLPSYAFLPIPSFRPYRSSRHCSILLALPAS